MPRPDPVRAWPFRPGARLANLVLEEELERGGMSVVWRARQGTRRGPVPCAVKTLRPELAHDPLYVRALRVEGELAQVVRHPHVVRCFDSSDVTHVANKVDPIADIAVIDTELALADHPVTVYSAPVDGTVLVPVSDSPTSVAYTHATVLRHVPPAVASEQPAERIVPGTEPL